MESGDARDINISSRDNGVSRVACIKHNKNSDLLSDKGGSHNNSS